jgi:hypothetical protein
MRYLLLLLLAACGEPNNPTGDKAVLLNDLGGYVTTPNHFVYKKHQYIQFGQGRALTVVHDPDCECLKTNK